MPAYITGLNIVAKTTDGQVTEHIGNDLGVDVNPFNYEINGIKSYFGGESDYAIIDGYTNYICLRADGYLYNSQEDYPETSHIRLGRVETFNHAISLIIDDRAFLTARNENPVPGPHAPSHKSGGGDRILVEEFATEGNKGRVPVSDGIGTLSMKQPLGSNVLLVGADFEYPTLVSALAAAATMSPGESNPIIIQLAPGIYAENNIFGPIELLDYVHISTIGPSGSSLLTPYNTDGFLLRSSPNGIGSLSGVAIVNCSGVTGGGILIDRGTINLFSDIIFLGCSICSRVTGSGVQAVFQSPKSLSCYNVFLVDSGAAIVTSNLIVQEMLGTCFNCIGGVIQADSFTTLATSEVGAKGCVVDYSGQVQLKGGIISNCNTALESNNGSSIRLDLVRFENSDAYDIFIHDAVSVIRSSSSEFSANKTYNPNNAPILGTFRDTDDNIMKNAGSLDMISGADTWLGIPRMTEAEQANMVLGWGEEEEGRQWFNTTKNKFVFWNGHSIKYIVPSQVVTVGKEGADFTSVSSALASITDASVMKPYTILVNAGIYMEMPFSLKPYISLQALGKGSCILWALLSDQPFISMVYSSELNGFTIIGPTSSQAVLVNNINQTAVAVCQFQMNQTSIKVTGSSAELYVDSCRFLTAGPPIGTALLCEGGGKISARSCVITAINALKANGGTIEAQVLKFISCTNGIYADNGGIINFSAVDCKDSVYSVRTGLNGTNLIQGSGIHTQNTIMYDVYQESSGSSIIINDSNILESKFFISDWNTIFLSYYSSGEANLYRFTSDLRVGVAEYGNKTLLGEGGCHNRGMYVFTTDDTASSSVDGGNLIDVSDNLRNIDSYSATFQGISDGYSMLIGSSLFREDVLKHWGLNILQTTAAVENTVKSFIFEIWDGSSWSEINVMALDIFNYYKYSNEVFIRADSGEGIFYGLNSNSTWAKKTIAGKNLYWSRIRIKYDLISLPEFKQIRLMSSGAYFGENGYFMFSGTSRFKRNFCSLANCFGEEGGIVTSNINVGSGGSPTGWSHRMPNSLMNGDGDAIQFQFTLPRGIDTSMPLSLKMNYSIVSVGTGDATFIASILPIEIQGVLEADPTGGIVPVARTLANTETVVSKQAQTVTNTSVPTAIDNKLQSITFGNFSIADYYEGDMVAIRVEMDDRAGSKIAIWDLDVLGTLCALGENQ